MFRIYLLLVGLVFSTHSFAHGGHDHGSLMSSLIHLTWLAPMVIAGVLCFSLRKKNTVENLNKSSQGE